MGTQRYFITVFDPVCKLLEKSFVFKLDFKTLGIIAFFVSGRVRERVSAVDGRLDMDQSFLVFDPVASDIFKKDQPTGRHDLSIHGSYYRTLS
jgi:hypothetical protein